MRRIVFIIIGLFAAFTMIRAYASTRPAESSLHKTKGHSTVQIEVDDLPGNGTGKL